YFLLSLPTPPSSTLFPYTTLFRSVDETRLRKPVGTQRPVFIAITASAHPADEVVPVCGCEREDRNKLQILLARETGTTSSAGWRSEEHTSELQSLTNLVCRLLLEK